MAAHTDKAVKRSDSECTTCENILLSLENCYDRKSLYAAAKVAVEYDQLILAILNVGKFWKISTLALIHFHQVEMFLLSFSRVLISRFRCEIRSRLSHSLHSLCKLYPTSTAFAGRSYTCNIRSGHPDGEMVDVTLTSVLVKSRLPEGAVGSGLKPPIAHLPTTVAFPSNGFQQSVSTASGFVVFTATILHSFVSSRTFDYWILTIVQFESNRPKFNRFDVVIDSSYLSELSSIHHACKVDIFTTAANG